MKTIEYRDVVDKTGWDYGPWMTEADKKQFVDATTGYPCLIVRGPMGALCGYVGVSRHHAAYGLHYDSVYDIAPEVSPHGGLTFGGTCAEEPTREQWEKWRASVYAGRDEAERYPTGDAARRLKERVHELEEYEAYVAWAASSRICHKVEPGEDDNIWWHGFDASHCFDFSPGLAATLRNLPTRSAMELSRGEVYRDMGYMENEVAQLALQLKAMDTWRARLYAAPVAKLKYEWSRWRSIWRWGQGGYTRLVDRERLATPLGRAVLWVRKQLRVPDRDMLKELREATDKLKGE